MPVPTEAYTRFLLVGVIVLLALWDLYVISMTGPEASISRVCLKWGEEFPLLLIILGVLIGHLFLRQSP